MLLHVDDDPRWPKSCVGRLAQCRGLVHADSIAEAIRQTKEHGPDMVVLDLALPCGDGDGAALIDSICARRPDARIIHTAKDASSALAAPADRVQIEAHDR